MSLTSLDWIIIVLALLVCFVPALFFGRRAGQGTSEFFASRRAVPWWRAGASVAEGGRVGTGSPQTSNPPLKETVPGTKGATARNQIKPATLATGLVVQVPPFVNEGDKVRVNTETGEYQSRV